MKKKGKKYIKLSIILMLMALMVCGCTTQAITKSFGGSMELHLEPNQKLEEITWKDDNLWYLTKPMTDSDVPETHTFSQSSSFGLFEGTITIIETKADEDVVKEYLDWKEKTIMTYDEYLIYKRHGYDINDILQGRVDYSIFSEN